jgi:hypothetical protein
MRFSHKFPGHNSLFDYLDIAASIAAIVCTHPITRGTRKRVVGAPFRPAIAKRLLKR